MSAPQGCSPRFGAGAVAAEGAEAAGGTSDAEDLSDSQLLRYSRHILLPECGIEGQRRWRAAHTLVVGAGGLGSPALLYLASAGVGRITVADGDVVELTNLQRQIAHAQDRIGQAKVASAQAAMLALNDDVQVQALLQHADDAFLDAHVPQADVVLDCSDNFATRQAVNAACVRHGKPLVSGAAVGWDGQVGVFHPAAGHFPCYACVFPPEAVVADVACATMGVFAPLVGLIGCAQAAEALKLLAGIGTPLHGRLLMLDARSLRWDELLVQRDPHCSVCGKH